MPLYKYRIEFKYHSILNQPTLDWIKEEVWRILSDITRDKITIKKINEKKTKSK